MESRESYYIVYLVAFGQNPRENKHPAVTKGREPPTSKEY